MNTSRSNVAVGIMSGKEISFVLNGDYAFNGSIFKGQNSATISKGKVLFKGEEYEEIYFSPVDASSTFTLKDVTIGKKFHWERKEDETFSGSLKVIADGDSLDAINVVDVEVYLRSVISSEMSCNAPLEYLKTQAVVSRSWLMRILQSRKSENISMPTEENDIINGIHRHLKWYENDAHKHFDVCADDHCQRYEGLSHAANPMAEKAVEETCGEVLFSGNEICDARFSKSCGGVSELFSSCWNDEDKSYLQPIRDSACHSLPDLTNEANAEKWIRSAPESFCNSNDDKVLSQVLNDYDLETKDFYRWKVVYKATELSALVKKNTGIDFGSIKNLVPLRRGASGRIIELLIEGTKKQMIIGKELEIRRVLSNSHLKSSAFVVDCFDADSEGVPARIEIVGAGWGHGVGLCQIGAAVMSSEGYDYRKILFHYFKNSKIKNIYV